MAPKQLLQRGSLLLTKGKWPQPESPPVPKRRSSFVGIFGMATVGIVPCGVPWCIPWCIPWCTVWLVRCVVVLVFSVNTVH